MRAAALVLLAFLAQDATVKGGFTTKAGGMSPSDTVAVWNPAKGELRVVFMPYKIQEKHLAEIRKDRTMFANLGEKSPDPKKWPNWCPAAEVKFILDPKALDKGPAAVKSYNLWAYGIEKKNFTHNMGQSGDEARKQVTKLAVKLDAKGVGTFELAFARKSDFDEGLDWDLTASGPILTPSEEK